MIVPNSTLQNWSNEINRFCPSLKSLILIGDQKSRATTLEYMKNRKQWDVCITSYEMVLREKGPLKRYSWKYVVIDEAHRIKNENTKLSTELRKFNSENRLLLTGTPLQVSQHQSIELKWRKYLRIQYTNVTLGPFLFVCFLCFCFT